MSRWMSPPPYYGHVQQLREHRVGTPALSGACYASNLYSTWSCVSKERASRKAVSGKEVSQNGQCEASFLLLRGRPVLSECPQSPYGCLSDGLVLVRKKIFPCAAINLLRDTGLYLGEHAHERGANRFV